MWRRGFPMVGRMCVSSRAGSRTRVSLSPRPVSMLCPALSQPRPKLGPQLQLGLRRPGGEAVASGPCPPSVQSWGMGVAVFLDLAGA